jgi:hypothetical protein
MVSSGMCFEYTAFRHMEFIMKTYIHVNQHVIRSNKKNNENNPVLSIKKGRKNTYCHRVKIHGPSEVVYSGNDHLLLPCGARVAIVTESEVEIIE